ncbi:UNVERIFIED_CONTAM: hypothetical protein FKN15_026752 [Acipenser sinensis]
MLIMHQSRKMQHVVILGFYTPLNCMERQDRDATMRLKDERLTSQLKSKLSSREESTCLMLMVAL